MHSLTSSIGLRVLNCSGFALDTIPSEKLLKVPANEFATIIMDAFKWSSVSREPIIGELLSYVFTGFIVDSCGLNNIGYQVNAS